MVRNNPKTVRVSCPNCDARSAFATIPKSGRVAAEAGADGKVHSMCRDCRTEFTTYFEYQ